jgi:hypothetical protein
MTPVVLALGNDDVKGFLEAGDRPAGLETDGG